MAAAYFFRSSILSFSEAATMQPDWKQAKICHKGKRDI